VHYYSAIAVAKQCWNICLNSDVVWGFVFDWCRMLSSRDSPCVGRRRWRAPAFRRLPSTCCHVRLVGWELPVQAFVLTPDGFLAGTHRLKTYP
jgi:hypothetical protein